MAHVYVLELTARLQGKIGNLFLYIWISRNRTALPQPRSKKVQNVDKDHQK